jgi:hypothetical protein
VLEQHGARGRELEPARTAVQQPRSELALERGDLLGDGRLRERQLARGLRERAPVSDGPERQQPSRFHSDSLSHQHNDYLNL